MYTRHHHYHHLVSDYTILTLVLLTCFITFTKVAGYIEKQVQVGLITAGAYLLWGIFHHLHEGDLHWKIVIEYTTFAIFGFVTLWVLLTIFV